MEIHHATVTTKDGRTHQFRMPLPESLDEAKNVYGEEDAVAVLRAGIKNKIMNSCRERFQKGMSVEEVEEAAFNWQPNSGAKSSSQSRVFDILTNYGTKIENMPEVKREVREHINQGEFNDALNLLETQLGLGR